MFQTQLRRLHVAQFLTFPPLYLKVDITQGRILPMSPRKPKQLSVPRLSSLLSQPTGYSVRVLRIVLSE